MYPMQGSNGSIGDKGEIGPEGDTLCELCACGKFKIVMLIGY